MKTQRRLQRKGAILAIALFLVTVAAVGTLLTARMVIDHRKLADRKFELARAFYLAEAGANQVAHWAAVPGDFTANPALFDPGAQGNFPSLSAALAQGGYDVPATFLNNVVSDRGDAVGSIKEIKLLPPTGSEPVPSLFRIRSVGRSAKGLEKTVEYYAGKNPIAAAKLPAGLISFSTAAASGNARVHWGEVWAKGDIAMLGKSQATHYSISDPNYDPWAKIRAVGVIDFPSTWKWGSGKDLFDPSALQPGLAPASGEYASAFFQKQPADSLAFPQFGYDAWKALAISHGTYYTTNAQGDLFRGPTQEPASEVANPMAEFGVADRATADESIVFIDTIDQKPPALDGANLATLKLSGNGLGLKGVFYVNAHLDASGVGNPPVTEAKRPDGQTQLLQKILLDGALFTAGTVKMSGNVGVYGGVVTVGGFTGAGTPDIYYNSELAKGPPSPTLRAPLKLSLSGNY